MLRSIKCRLRAYSDRSCAPSGLKVPPKAVRRMLTACFFLSRLRQFLAFQSLNAMGVDTCVQQTINDGKETACMETTATAPTDRALAIKKKKALDASFFKKGIAIAALSSIMYALYTAFVTGGQLFGVWGN